MIQIKRSALLTVCGLASIASVASAEMDLIDSGSFSIEDCSILASGVWEAGNFSLDWEVFKDGSEYTYEYTFNVPEKDMSHWILELCDDITVDGLTITEGTHQSIEIATFGAGLDNPGFPVGEDFYGIKFDSTQGVGEVVFSLTTDRAPESGSFYVKDGVDEDGIQLFAHNSGLADSEHGAFIAIPGCHTIPEPSSFALVGLGAGLLLVLRRKLN